MKLPMTSAQRWVLALVSISSLMVILDMMVVTTALDTIRRDLGASIGELEWTLNAFTLSFAVLLMPASAIGERLGRKRLFMIGLGLFTVASVACAVAPNSGLLITGRAVQGAAAAMIMSHAMGLLSFAFPPAQRGKALGIFSSVTGLGTLGGPLVGGVITQGLDWHWIFWLNVPIGVVLLPLVNIRIEESTGSPRSTDVGGLILVTTAAFGLVWGLVRGATAGWASLEVSGALAGGALLTIAFITFELRAPEPALPMGFFRSRVFSAGNAVGFLLYGALFGAVFLLAQFMQVTLGYGPLDTGLRMAPWTATVFIVAPIAGSLVNQLGERVLIFAGLCLQAVGFGWIAVIASPGLYYPEMIAPLFVAGCGISLAMPGTQNAVIGAVPRTAVGTASGIFNTFRQLGGTFGIAIAAAVFAGSGSYLSPKAFSDGFTPAMVVAAGMSVVAAVAGLWTPGSHSTDAPAPSPKEPVLQKESQ